MAHNYGNLGNVYQTRGELDKAEEMHKKSLILFQEMNSSDAKKAQQLLDDLAQHRAKQQAPSTDNSR